jgi:tRNA modification GTPase
MSHVEETIFALSSGARGVRAGVAIIRISGPGAKDVLEQLLSRENLPFPKPRVASYRKLYGHTSTVEHGILDKALVIWFPAPNTFTGEDIVELHLHGGRAVVSGGGGGKA